MSLSWRHLAARAPHLASLAAAAAAAAAAKTKSRLYLHWRQIMIYYSIAVRPPAQEAAHN